MPFDFAQAEQMLNGVNTAIFPESQPKNFE